MQNIHGELNDLSSRFGDSPIDVFNCSASFETRCRSITESLGDIPIDRSIVAYNKDLLPVVKENLKYLSGQLGAKVGQDHHFELPLDSNQPILTADNIANNVGNAIENRAQRFVIDTTTFTRESLLILVRFLKARLNSSVSVDFLYARAKEYSVGDDDDHKWLSKGIRDVRSVLGYPGDLLPSRRNHLIVLVGFEDVRALSLIRECEPARISLGIVDGMEVGTGPHQKTNEQRVARLKSFVGDSATDFGFKGYDVDATLEILRQEVNNNRGFNTIIAPMNTKISTLAAAALAFENETIQICYVQPNYYNYSKYSVADSDFYFFRLPGYP